MLLPQTFSCEQSFSIPAAKVFPLESFVVYSILFIRAETDIQIVWVFGWLTWYLFEYQKVFGYTFLHKFSQI